MYSHEGLLAAGQSWLGKGEEFELFSRLVAASDVRRRHYAVPAAEVLNLVGQAQRAALFEELAPDLLHEAGQAALEQGGWSAQQASALVFTSCTYPAIPSIDARLVDSLGLARTVQRVPMYQQGCAGGVAGLALAARLCTDSPVLLASAELCSLVLHPEDRSAESLLSAALFSDGAACAVIAPGGSGLRFEAMQSFLLPNTRHIMGYRPADNGPHLLLDRALPGILAENLPQLVRGFLEQQGSTTSEIHWWLFHPGGTRILDTIEQSFALTREQTYWSWETLRHDGNMSSATILYVLKSFLADRQYAPGDRVLVAGIGPGLTIELLLLRCVV